MADNILILRLAELFSLVGASYWFAHFILSARQKYEDTLDYTPVGSSVLEKSARTYSTNTNSIVHLYGEVRHFKPFEKSECPEDREALIGYVDFQSCAVMLTEPLCAPDKIEAAIIEFARRTAEKERRSILFPIGEAAAKMAKTAGYGLLQVGNEAVFNLKTYSPLDIHKKVLSSVAQLVKKGIEIKALTYQQIVEANYEPELNEILDEWLLSRKSSRMHLLLEVSPFKFPEDKKYFIARSENKIEAFLACSPVFARNGYFIHDLIRRPTAINGVSEALIIKALSTFKEQGYDFASLGTAPLSGLDGPGVNQNYKILNRILINIFTSHKTFMNFKSLYTFKKKFKPTSEEPTFLAFYPPQLKVADILSVGRLFSANGILGDVVYKAKRWMSGNQLPRPVLNLLSPDVITLARPVPFTFFEFVSRLSFTLSIFALNIYTYFNSTNMVGDLNLSTIQTYGFSYQDFFSHKWFILVTANFLHFTYIHLFGNMAMLILFSGILEFIAGSSIAAFAFLIAMNADVPTGMILLPILKAVNVTAWQQVISYMDVGASLGIMGSLGALIQFFKHKNVIITIAISMTIMVEVAQNEIFGLDHTVALAMGYLVGYLYLQRYRVKPFQRFFVPSDQPIQSSPR